MQPLGLLVTWTVCFVLQALSASLLLHMLSHGHHRGCVNGLLDLQPVHTGTARLPPAVHQKASLGLLFAQLVAPCLRVTNVCVQLFEFVCSCINDVIKKKRERAGASGRTNSENLKFKCLSNVKLLLCYSYKVLFFFLSP